jgi:hypothetical protein
MVKLFSDSKRRIVLIIILVLIIIGPATYVDYQNSSGFLLSRVVLDLNWADLIIVIGSTIALACAISLFYKNKSKR